MQRSTARRAALIYLVIGMMLLVAGLLVHAYRRALGLSVTFTGVGFVLGSLLVVVATGSRRHPKAAEDNEPASGSK